MESCVFARIINFAEITEKREDETFSEKIGACYDKYFLHTCLPKGRHRG